MKNKIWLLTGEKQSGKTTALKQYRQHPGIYGILTPVIQDQRYFEEVPGSRRYPMNAAPDETEVFSVGTYRFSESAFAQANRSLLAMAYQSKTKWLMIDEIGPLELHQHLGFMPVLGKLKSDRPLHFVLLVVRPTLISAIESFFSEPLPVLKTSELGQDFFSNPEFSL